MSITLELSAEAEAKLRESIARNDAESVQNILTEATKLTTQSLLRSSPLRLSPVEFEAAADRLADEFEKNLSPNAAHLSDRILTREEIYQDHP